jgi:hypothetical protein
MNQPRPALKKGAKQLDLTPPIREAPAEKDGKAGILDAVSPETG